MEVGQPFQAKYPAKSIPALTVLFFLSPPTIADRSRAHRESARGRKSALLKVIAQSDFSVAVRGPLLSANSKNIRKFKRHFYCDEPIVAMTVAYCLVLAQLVSGEKLAEAATDPGIKIEPAWKVSLVYGMPCAIYHQLPAAYYLGARFANDFASAVLNAINGGGQNQARAILTGALVGAQV